MFRIQQNAFPRLLLTHTSFPPRPCRCRCRSRCWCWSRCRCLSAPACVSTGSSTKTERHGMLWHDTMVTVVSYSRATLSREKTWRTEKYCFLWLWTSCSSCYEFNLKAGNMYSTWTAWTIGGDWPPDEGCVNYVIVQLTLQRSVRLFVYVSPLAYSRHQLMTREIYMDITLIRCHVTAIYLF